MNKYLTMLLFLITIYSAGASHTSCKLPSGSRNYCRNSYCYLYTNATGQVGETLTYCTANSSYTYRYIYIYFKGNINIELNLPGKVHSLYFFAIGSGPNITLTSNKVHPNITLLYFRYQTFNLFQPSFFNFFPNLQRFYAYSFLNFAQPQTFSSLSKLTALNVKPPTGSIAWKLNIARDAFHGMTNLKYIELVRADLTDVRYTFNGLVNLRHLGLEGNMIAELEPDMFKTLKSLTYLDVDGNGIKVASVDALNGLTALKYFSISGNPSFPLNSLTRLQSLTNLQINYNSYRTLSADLFEQMPSLRYLYADNPFFCDCSLRWTSLVSKYGLRIITAYCLEPSKVYRTPITSPALYTNCTLDRSYDCFTRTKPCPNDFVCRDTNSSHACTCTDGFSLTSKGLCVDEDECQMGQTHCAQNCNNIIGSYECNCNEGFMLAADDKSCDDINECEMGLAHCSPNEICVNSVGTYKCEVVGCQANTVQQHPSNMPLLAIVIVLAVVVVIFVVIIVVMATWIFVKKNRNKNRHPHFEFIRSDNAHFGDTEDDVNLLEAVNTTDEGVGELYPAPVVEHTQIN